MIEAELHKRVADRVHEHHNKDFYFAFSIAVLMALMHTYWQITEFTKIAEFKTLTSPTVLYLSLVIELGLLLNVLGLWLHKALGVWIAILALSDVSVGYVVWYIYSRQVLQLLLSQPFYHLHPEAVPPHPFGLIGATWINLIVLLTSGVLLIWEVKRARRLLVHRP